MTREWWAALREAGSLVAGTSNSSRRLPLIYRLDEARQVVDDARERLGLKPGSVPPDERKQADCARDIFTLVRSIAGVNSDLGVALPACGADVDTRCYAAVSGVVKKYATMGEDTSKAVKDCEWNAPNWWHCSRRLEAISWNLAGLANNLFRALERCSVRRADGFGICVGEIAGSAGYVAAFAMQLTTAAQHDCPQVRLVLPAWPGYNGTDNGTEDVEDDEDEDDSGEGDITSVHGRKGLGPLAESLRRWQRQEASSGAGGEGNATGARSAQGRAQLQAGQGQVLPNRTGAQLPLPLARRVWNRAQDPPECQGEEWYTSRQQRLHERLFDPDAPTPLRRAFGRQYAYALERTTQLIIAAKCARDITSSVRTLFLAAARAVRAAEKCGQLSLMCGRDVARSSSALAGVGQAAAQVIIQCYDRLPLMPLNCTQRTACAMTGGTLVKMLGAGVAYAVDAASTCVGSIRLASSICGSSISRIVASMGLMAETIGGLHLACALQQKWYSCGRHMRYLGAALRVTSLALGAAVLNCGLDAASLAWNFTRPISLPRVYTYPW